MRPEGATHSDDYADYYKSAGELNWMRWSKTTREWFTVGTLPRGTLTPLPAVQVVELEKFDAPTQAELCNAFQVPIPRELCSGEPQPTLARAAQAASPDYQDELGKVWDALNANGIESAGELSASEGVQQLVVEHRLQLDELLYGNSFASVDANGVKTRIDPTTIVMRQRKL